MATFPTNPAASALDGSEIVPLTQGGTDKRTTVQEISDANESKSADIASAATTDLSTATAAFVHITGTTTITALGTVQAGTRRIVVFDGALTLTHNGTSLILPTGADITTAAGDVATFVSEGGGNWRCVDYTKADGTALAGSSGGGDVAGPASSTDSHVALFDGTTGKLLKDGGALGGMAGINDAPSDGTGYVRKDGAWAAESDVAGVPIITEATTSRTIAPADAGSYHRFTATGAKTATFDDGDGFTAGQEFHIANRAASDNLALTPAGTMTLNPPKGGTLVLAPGDTVTVKLVDTDEADVFGSTEAA